MARTSHLHSGAGLLAATAAVLVLGVGVVQRPAAPSRIDSRLVAAAQDLARETTTTAAPVTTTAPPPETTTTTSAPPPPPPVPTTEPPASPTTVRRAAPATTTTAAAVPAGAQPGEDGPTYAMRLLREVVPAAWLARVPVHVEVIAGKTSWSSWGGLIQVGDWHLYSSEARARNVLAHEWGHQAAWRYGTDVVNGAPPAGFPYDGRIVEERWADCVAEALTGTSYPTSGLPRCPGDALSFTSAWLAAGPGTPLR